MLRIEVTTYLKLGDELPPKTNSQSIFGHGADLRLGAMINGGLCLHFV